MDLRTRQAFLCALVPALIVTQPSDASADELPSTLALAAILMTPFILAGASLEAMLRGTPRRRHEISG